MGSLSDALYLREKVRSIRVPFRGVQKTGFGLFQKPWAERKYLIQAVHLLLLLLALHHTKRVVDSGVVLSSWTGELEGK